MEINIEKAMLHILDNDGGTSIVSEKNIVLEEELADFIEKHLKKSFEDIDGKETQWETRDNELYDELVQFKRTQDFIRINQDIAGRFLKVFDLGSDVPSADLLIVVFRKDQIPYLGVLKFNYRNSYIHHVETEDGVRATIVKQPYALPLETQKLEEYVLMDLFDDQLKIKERKFTIAGEKRFYISEMIVKSKSSLSEKSSIDIVEKSAKKLIAQEYGNDLEKWSDFKDTLSEDYINNQEINIDRIAEKTFKDQDGKAAFKEEVEKYGLVDGQIKLGANAEKRVLRKHKIVTETGIEISIPPSFLKDKEMIEFQNNRDGSVSILIKNIGEFNSR